MAGCGGNDDGEAEDNADRSATEAIAETGTFEADALTEEHLANLSEREVAGFQLEQSSLTEVSATMSYESEGEGRPVSALVTVTGCDPFTCWDLLAEVTAEHEENLRSNLAPVHLDNPDLVFEYGTVELEPRKQGFFMYSRSFVQDGRSTATANNYTLVYHDDANQITVRVSPPLRLGAQSAEELEAQLDQAGAEEVAKTIFAAFSGEFENN